MLHEIVENGVGLQNVDSGQIQVRSHPLDSVLRSLKQTAKEGNAYGGASVRRPQFCVDALNPTVYGFGLKIHGRTDHFAAVSSSLAAQEVQVGFCEARTPG